jgi:hypothetical protein
MCIPDGGSCSSGDCCSGLVCKGPPGQGTCAASCIPPNAMRCPPSIPDFCGGGCTCVDEVAPGLEGYCSDAIGSIACTTSCDCPAGQFCQGGGLNICTVAAERCPTG